MTLALRVAKSQAVQNPMPEEKLKAALTNVFLWSILCVCVCGGGGGGGGGS